MSTSAPSATTRELMAPALMSTTLTYFGYHPQGKVANTQTVYSPDAISQYVDTHFKAPHDDICAAVNTDIIHDILVDYISHAPPYRQVLLIDGQRPNGKPRYVNIGKTPTVIRRPGMSGIYDYYGDTVDVALEVQRTTDMPLHVPSVLKPASEIKNTIAHEISHQQDRQLGNTWSLNTSWSQQSRAWAAAIAQEITSGNTDDRLEGIATADQMKLSQPYYQQAHEAKAEFERLHELVYRANGGDLAEAGKRMQKAYPHMWPVFKAEYLDPATAMASRLNPHIDMQGTPIGFRQHTIINTSNNMQASDNPSLKELRQQGRDQDTRTWHWQLEQLRQEARGLNRDDDWRSQCHQSLLQQASCTEADTLNGMSKTTVNNVREIIRAADKLPQNGVTQAMARLLKNDTRSQANQIAVKVLQALDHEPDMLDQPANLLAPLYNTAPETQVSHPVISDALYKVQKTYSVAGLLAPVAEQLKKYVGPEKEGQPGKPDIIELACQRITQARMSSAAYIGSMRTQLEETALTGLSRTAIQQSFIALSTEISAKPQLASQELKAHLVQFSAVHKWVQRAPALAQRPV